MKDLLSKRRGFSLIELLLVVTILGFLASLILPRMSLSADTAKEKTCFHHRAQINGAVERWYLVNDSWPANDLSDIAADIDYFPEGIPNCPVSNVPYVLNGTTHRVIGHLGGGKGGGHP